MTNLKASLAAFDKSSLKVREICNYFYHVNTFYSNIREISSYHEHTRYYRNSDFTVSS